MIYHDITGFFMGCNINHLSNGGGSASERFGNHHGKPHGDTMGYHGDPIGWNRGPDFETTMEDQLKELKNSSVAGEVNGDQAGRTYLEEYA